MGQDWWLARQGRSPKNDYGRHCVCGDCQIRRAEHPQVLTKHGFYVDEKLANNAYGIAINSEDPDEKHLNKAASELAKADEDMSMMNYLKSIKHYGKAWKESIKAN